MIFLLILSIAITACGGAGNNGDASADNAYFKVAGLNFSPYTDGQDPNLGSYNDEEQLMQRMGIIEPYTKWIRTFGSSNGLEKSGAIARALGLKAALGAWIGKDLTANEQEIENLISSAQAGEADMLIVGSEVLLRGDLSETAIVDYINRVKQAVPELPVSYADVYSILLSHPNIVDAVDIILVNYYPYWEGISIEIAVAAIHDWHAQVSAISKGKQIIVSETGWPSGGDIVGNAVPSAENAAFYFLNFVSWAHANSIDFFYFEAFDESWKASYEGPQGAHWGVWDKEGNLKPGMEAVFNGETIQDNWSNGGIPGGSGDPTIEFTYIPPLGSFENLVGQVWHVDPSDHKVAVYIYVSGWWTKPTFANPLTTIQVDGSWITDITTGGIDEQATRIASFLLPDGYNPPFMSGGVLPDELDQNAIAKVDTTRPH
jgi:exo-beta-1,3-glucanase (GH17 family)